MSNIHVITGGTVFHIRPHLALSAPAYGTIGRTIQHKIQYWRTPLFENRRVILHETKMANPSSKIETNDDVRSLLDEIVKDPNTKVIFMTAALCDFEASMAGGVGKDRERLNSSAAYEVSLTPAEKLLGQIRKVRKDIFLVACKTTAGRNANEQFEAGLSLLKRNGVNLVLCNDLHTRVNMVVTPEEARYHVTTDRDTALTGLIEMAGHRSSLRFTRSNVVDGPLVKFDSAEVPEALRTVVAHCVKRGAYKPFNGTTVGHFAFRGNDGDIVTSVRKSNFNTDLFTKGMVRIRSNGPDDVTAFGAKPSVGGQSQRIIFDTYKDVDSIVHFHCPTKPGSAVSVRQQRLLECGSHECGRNTADGLRDVLTTDGSIKAVMLEKHGPNIVFNSNKVRPEAVIQFIEDNFDLTASTRDLE